MKHRKYLYDFLTNQPYVVLGIIIGTTFRHYFMSKFDTFWQAVWCGTKTFLWWNVGVLVATGIFVAYKHFKSKRSQCR